MWLVGLRLERALNYERCSKKVFRMLRILQSVAPDIYTTSIILKLQKCKHFGSNLFAQQWKKLLLTSAGVTFL